MDFEISFIDDGRIALVKTSGLATLEGFDAYLNALTSDPRWRAGMDVLSDHSELDLSGLSSQEIEDLTRGRFSRASVVGSGTGGGRLAIVAGTPSGFGFGRMFEVHAEDLLPFRVRVFATSEEALEWLREQRPAPRD